MKLHQIKSLLEWGVKRSKERVTQKRKRCVTETSKPQTGEAVESVKSLKMMSRLEHGVLDTGCDCQNKGYKNIQHPDKIRGTFLQLIYNY